MELSGGESQKVAIARCLYKDAPFAVMDEPTAALDPVAEEDIYQRMNRFIGDKGAVYISHRLVELPLLLDRILVFEGGCRLKEQGSHKELLELHGLYMTGCGTRRHSITGRKRDGTAASDSGSAHREFESNIKNSFPREISVL